MILNLQFEIIGCINMHMKAQSLKPQDALLLLKLLASSEKLAQKDLANALGLSQAEICHALKRLEASQLVDRERAVRKESALEFILHGLKYAFPAIFGQVAIGVPTAHSNPSLDLVQYDKNNPLSSIVWPDPHGSVRGQSISPIYESASEAARKDPKLHEILSLVDMIRVGKARERDLAASKLKERLASV